MECGRVTFADLVVVWLARWWRFVKARTQISLMGRRNKRKKKAIREAWHHQRYALVMGAAALTVVVTGTALEVSSGRRSGPCLARGKKKQGKEATQVA